MKFTSILALALTVAAVVAIMTVMAVPKSPTISEAADDSIYRPAFWKVF